MQPRLSSAVPRRRMPNFAVSSFTLPQIASYNKPTLVTEFGCDDVSGQRLTRAGVHAGIWAPWFAGAAGAGAGW